VKAEAFARVEKLVKPYLTSQIEVRMYNVETTICEHLVETLTQVA